MIETIISARNRSIGAMDVRRVLPYSKRRSVGPFVFVDDFGPIEIVSDGSMDVLPHPHIGLATVTYLFEGAMLHRDSLGSVQEITPGDVNWMTAGSGIVHSERVSGIDVAPGSRLQGLQTWVALPESDEEANPSFSHTDSSELPVFDAEGVKVKLILGRFSEFESPVETLGDPFYAECRARPDSVLEFEPDQEERAVYALFGNLRIGADVIGPGDLAVIKTENRAEVIAENESLYMILGGTRIEKQRFMFWNFVSSSRERIEKAKDDWNANRFDPIPGETDRIPLPAFGS